MVEDVNCSTSSKSRSLGNGGGSKENWDNSSMDDCSSTTNNSQAKKKKGEILYESTAANDDGVKPHALVPVIPAQNLRQTYTLTCIAALMSPYPPAQFFSFIVLRLLKIVSALTHNGKQFIPYNYKNQKGTMKSSNYSCMFLFADAYSPEGQCCYIIEEKAKNEKLWKSDWEEVQDGTMTIGTTIAIQNPGPITNLYAGDVPMMETREKAIIFNDPKNTQK